MPKIWRQAGPRFNNKMTSYQYRKSHCGDKKILRPSYLHNGISYTGKTTFYIESGPWASCSMPITSVILQWMNTMQAVIHGNCLRRYRTYNSLFNRMLHFCSYIKHVERITSLKACIILSTKSFQRILEHILSSHDFITTTRPCALLARENNTFLLSWLKVKFHREDNELDFYYQTTC